jgi:hypothetical protein
MPRVIYCIDTTCASCCLPHNFQIFSSTMHKLYFVIYFQNINGALHATCHLLHGYHLCFMLLATFSYPTSTRQGLH